MRGRLTGKCANERTRLDIASSLPIQRPGRGTKQAVARKEANADKRDAEYKVVIEKCDALSGAAKDTCVGNAKAQYGNS